MKKLLTFILLATMLSCNWGKITVQQARQCVEGYYASLAANNLQKADSYYAEIYSLTETTDDRIRKMERLQSVLGPVVSYELTDSVLIESFGEPSEVKLTYSVKHEKAVTKETFTVINDEGSFKISAQSVENQ